MPVLLAVLVLAVSPAWGRSEQSLSERVLARDPPGERVRLGEGPARFLALHLPPVDPESARGVVLVHRAGAHLDGPMLRYLRVGLARKDWHTLTLALPYTPPTGDRSDLAQWEMQGAERLPLAVGYLAERGVRTTVLLAEGTGGRVARRYFEQGIDPTVTGFVGVGAVYAPAGAPATDWALTDAWPKRILELYAERGLPAVRRRIDGHRGQLLEFPDISLRAIRVGGARSDFRGHEAAVRKYIEGWLEQHPG